ncbi:MAG: APC family permease [Aquidulcibacter sp.]|jgi:amino acid transporter|uniref:APC family permease n=1 Tax=Aquidulcibacter sp. TaxID=2052990 RepID=UPI0022BB23BF|nr:APC family permease [Aquidulcibacter sp.]
MSEQNVTQPPPFKRVLGLFDITLFTVCAILVVDTLAASAAIGTASLSWWFVTLILFFIPYGLVTAELGSTYPGEGGIQDWIRRAYGDRWAARTVWYYWVNVALWMPSGFILMAGMATQLFAPSLGLWTQIAIAIGATWLTVLIGITNLSAAKWIPNLGAAIKVAIMLLIGVAGISALLMHGPANDLSWPNLIPRFDSGLAFLPVIVYSFLGFELMSGAGDEIKNPARDVPIAVITAGVLISIFYVLATFGILVALPIKDIGLIEGLLDTIKALFASWPMADTLVMIVGVGAIFSIIANLVTWSMGANRTALAAAQDNELPAVFGRLRASNQTPIGAYVLTGLVSTAVILLYGFIAGSAEDLFWTLFAFSSIIFLMPYLGLFPAFVKLRKADPDTLRPYRVPGGIGFVTLLATICGLFILQAIVLFVFVPGQAVEWAKTGPILIGVAITVVIGEFVITSHKAKES